MALTGWRRAGASSKALERPGHISQTRASHSQSGSDRQYRVCPRNNSRVLYKLRRSAYRVTRDGRAVQAGTSGVTFGWARLGSPARLEHERLRQENDRVRQHGAEQAKRIAALEQHLALRQQNATTTSKPRSSGGLAGNASGAAGRRV